MNNASSAVLPIGTEDEMQKNLGMPVDLPPIK